MLLRTYGTYRIKKNIISVRREKGAVMKDTDDGQSGNDVNRLDFPIFYFVGYRYVYTVQRRTVFPWYLNYCTARSV